MFCCYSILAGSGDERDDDDDDSSLLNAETLRLGESPSPSEADSDEVDVRDSQVSSGWLGKAYMTHNAQEKEEKRVGKIHATAAVPVLSA